MTGGAVLPQTDVGGVPLSVPTTLQPRSVILGRELLMHIGSPPPAYF